MARRGKTVLKGPDTDKMLRASEQGEAMVARAHEGMMRQKNIEAERVTQTSRRIGDVVRGAEEKEYQRGQQKEQVQFQRDVATGQAAQKQQQIDLEFAERGYQKGEGGPTSPLLDDRRQALQTEMDQGAAETGGQPVSPEEQAAQQRQREQMGKPLGDSPYITPTEEGKERQAVQQGQRQSQLETQRMNAQARQMNAATAWNKGRFAKDKEAMANAKEVMQGPLRRSTSALNSIMNDEPLSAKDKSWLLSETEGHPVHEDVKNFDSLADKTGVIEHLKNLTDKNVIGYMKKTGELPDSEFVDWSSNKMQALAQGIAWTKRMGKSMGIGAYKGIRTKEDMVRMINQMAATFTADGLMAPPEPPSPLPPDQGGGQPGGVQVDQVQRPQGAEPYPPPPTPTQFAPEDKSSAGPPQYPS